MSIIEINNISHSYGDGKVLENINLSINEGEFFTLLGPSGCGKTTLLRIIAGFIKNTQGAVLLEGKDITHMPTEKRNIGFVFQNYALFSHMTVFQNVCFGLKVKGLSKTQCSETANHYLKMVNMDKHCDRKISQLSGGQQQRVALARSIAIEPKILLLDEPMSNLDMALREEMRQELKNLQKTLNITTIFVTHDQTEALSLSDRIAIINGGKCLQCDTPYNVYYNPSDAFTAGFLGKSNVILKEDFKHFSIDIKKDCLYVRPQMINIFNSQQAGTIKAIIEKVEFLGSISRYTCNCGKFKVIVEELSCPQNIKNIGDKVFLKIQDQLIRE